MKTILLAIVALALCACASKQAVVKPAKPEPKVIVKEIAVPQCLMSTVPTTGSPCLDALRLHMKLAGCKKTETTGDRLNGPVFIRCLEPTLSPPMGGLFVMLPAGGMVKHKDFSPWCFDRVLGISVGNVTMPEEKPGK